VYGEKGYSSIHSLHRHEVTVQWPPSRSARFTPRKDPTIYAANRRLIRPKNRTGCIGEEKQRLSSQGVEPRYNDTPAVAYHTKIRTTLSHLQNDRCVFNQTSISSEISKTLASFLITHTNGTCVPVSREKNDDTLESGKATSRRTELSELLLPV
jgi:hypothetical protein